MEFPRLTGFLSGQSAEINAGNVRVFYVYGKADNIYGIHGYTKKTQSIPQKEFKQARQIVKALKHAGLI